MRRRMGAAATAGLAGFWWLICAAALAAPAPSDSIITRESRSRISIHAQGQPLGDLLKELRKSCRVKVMGLEYRMDEPLTFSVENERVDRAMRRLLRHLEETNYAMFYSRRYLKRIAVLPSGGGPGGAFPSMPPAARPSAETRPASGMTKAVRIVNINEGSQAESLDLQRGDLVVEYDGLRILNSKQLVDAVKEKGPEDVVEMVVVRGRQPIRVTLGGGLIGINVRTVTVPASELGN